MTTKNTLLAEVSGLVKVEFAKYLSDAFPIAEVTSEFLTDADGEEYVRTMVILEDGHPKLDGRVLNKFSMHIDPICTERGFNRPTIAYANRSEIPV